MVLCIVFISTATVGSDGSVAALEASPVPDLIVSVVSSGSVGRGEARQFIINEVRGLVGEYDSVRVGANDDVDVPIGLGGGVSPGVGFDSCDSDDHLSGERRAACGPSNAIGTAGSGCLCGAIRAPVSCRSSQHSEGEGGGVDGVCALGLGGHVGCAAGVVASVVRVV